MSYASDLKQYPLPERIAANLSQSDRVAQNMARAGRSVPPKIMLYSRDFDAIDRIVRLVTSGRQTAETVTWNGRHVSRYDETRALAG